MGAPDPFLSHAQTIEQDPHIHTAEGHGPHLPHSHLNLGRPTVAHVRSTAILGLLITQTATTISGGLVQETVCQELG